MNLFPGVSSYALNTTPKPSSLQNAAEYTFLAFQYYIEVQPLVIGNYSYFLLIDNTLHSYSLLRCQDPD